MPDRPSGAPSATTGWPTFTDAEEPSAMGFRSNGGGDLEHRQVGEHVTADDRGRDGGAGLEDHGHQPRRLNPVDGLTLVTVPPGHRASHQRNVPLSDQDRAPSPGALHPPGMKLPNAMSTPRPNKKWRIRRCRA